MQSELSYQRFVLGERAHPHAILGLHEHGAAIRLWRPGQDESFIVVNGEKKALEQVHRAGLFQGECACPLTRSDYQVIYPNRQLSFDPYAFLPTLTRRDEKLIKEGKHPLIYRVLGSHAVIHQGIAGVKFAVWAPCAVSVVLMGTFNQWSPEAYPMRRMGSCGVFELFVPGLDWGEHYQYGIYTQEGEFLHKADPYAFQGEMRPKTRSIVCSIDRFTWKDEAWLSERKNHKWDRKPLNIYEVHLGAWRRKENRFMNYRDIASELTTYCLLMGFTHVELLPVMGHPLDESWGYQVSGYYALSRRYGSIEDFQYFVNFLHRHHIGVILDWVPGHFPVDQHALARFDGTCLYEHLDPKQGFHPQWTTHIFNFGRYEVTNFLIGSALFYLKEMHIDGLRVDDVSSMIYLDFARTQGEWIPNARGGNENLEAIDFLRALTTQLKREVPDALLIAEESHAFPGVTRAVCEGGLGFDLKWSLGWANDTLRFFSKPVAERNQALGELVHELSYFYDERNLLPLSHDEVAHGKKSLLAKMPGNENEKFANLRVFLSYMICHPGKKLLFMGSELGQWHEWAVKEEIHWELLGLPYHQKLHHCLGALYRLYLTCPALFEWDFDKKGLMWVDQGSTRPVLSYTRRSRSQTVLCLHHFDTRRREQETFTVKGYQSVRQLITTDSLEYGGYGILTKEPRLAHGELTLDLPPLTTVVFELQ